jgi:hypothetical protein
VALDHQNLSIIFLVGNNILSVQNNLQSSKYYALNIFLLINPANFLFYRLCEVDRTSGGTVTRTVAYYPVAGAMRIDSTQYYMLKEHLGIYHY